MKSLPHTYSVGASGTAAGSVSLVAAGLPALPTNAPREFDGPGDQWSPESLLCASVASCFILTFRVVARAAKLDWHHLECCVEGILDRVEGVMQFTRVITHAKLVVNGDASPELCRRLLEKAEHGCLIASSLRAQRELQSTVLHAQEPKMERGTA